MNILRRSDSGYSIVELTVALTMILIGGAAVATVIKRVSSFSLFGVSSTVVEENGRVSMTRLTDLISETSILHVDTTMRFHQSTFDMNSDRFTMVGMRQCSSSVCGFHTDSNLAVTTRNYRCSFEYMNGSNSGAVAGKVWPDDMESCEFDGSALRSHATLDLMKVFSARTPAGDFEMEDGAPRYENLVFVVPVPTEKGTCRLLRIDLHVDALMAAAPPTFSADWDRWDPQEPNMPELFDFGSDGTTDGSPDGSVPLSAEQSDADIEFFFLTGLDNQPTLFLRKSLGIQGDPIYRELSLSINLETGVVSFVFTHYDTATTFWSSVGEIAAPIEVLATDVTEFAVSTAASNPYDALTNPTGVENTGMVRVSIGTSRRFVSDGDTSWVHSIDEFSVRARN